MSKPIDRLTPQGKQFERMLKELTSKEVHVGFQRGDAQDENGVDMCDIAMWNELQCRLVRPDMRVKGIGQEMRRS